VPIFFVTPARRNQARRLWAVRLHSPYDFTFITECLSTRHWIVDNGQKWLQVLYVYMSVTHLEYNNLLCDVIATSRAGKDC